MEKEKELPAGWHVRVSYCDNDEHVSLSAFDEHGRLRVRLQPLARSMTVVDAIEMLLRHID